MDKDVYISGVSAIDLSTDNYIHYIISKLDDVIIFGMTK